MQVDIHVCIHTYMNVIEHTFDMSMSKYSCNIANMHHTANKLTMHIEPTFLHEVPKQTNYNVYITCFYHVFANYKYAFQMPHAQIP